MVALQLRIIGLNTPSTFLNWFLIRKVECERYLCVSIGSVEYHQRFMRLKCALFVCLREIPIREYPHLSSFSFSHLSPPYRSIWLSISLSIYGEKGLYPFFVITNPDSTLTP